MDASILIAGSGGQGVLSLGRVAVNAVARENRFATYYPSYGAEIRGGTANCMVKVSDTIIHSPVITAPTDLVVMNLPSLLKFAVSRPPSRTLVLNTTLANDLADTMQHLRDALSRMHVLRIPATEIAERLGSVRVANMVMLGALVAAVPFVRIESVEGAIAALFKSGLTALNLQAFHAGYETARTLLQATTSSIDRGAAP